MNYNLEMEKMMEEIPQGTELLLHTCCAPCSSACIERLSDRFKIIILYYNPNITDKDEYDKRLAEVKRFIKEIPNKYGIDIIDAKYDPDSFFEISRGLEKEKERGKRCYKCYKLRLEETAKVAEENNIKYFATTLTLSPYKKADWINEIGEELNNKYNTTYLYSDFKKKNGYKRSIELSKEYNLYRQDYCGCVYSLRDRIEE